MYICMMLIEKESISFSYDAFLASVATETSIFCVYFFYYYPNSSSLNVGNHAPQFVIVSINVTMHTILVGNCQLL